MLDHMSVTRITVYYTLWELAVKSAHLLSIERECFKRGKELLVSFPSYFYQWKKQQEDILCLLFLVPCAQREQAEL